MTDTERKKAEDDMDLIARLAEIIGDRNVLTGDDCVPYARDWTAATPRPRSP